MPDFALQIILSILFVVCIYVLWIQIMLILYFLSQSFQVVPGLLFVHYACNTLWVTCNKMVLPGNFFCVLHCLQQFLLYIINIAKQTVWFDFLQK